MGSRVSTQAGIIVSLIIFTAIAIFVPDLGPNSQIEILLGATTFIYGIMIAFYISFSTSRLNEIGQLLNSEDSTYVTIYRITATFGEGKQKEVQGLLDDLLVNSIDYHLDDYEKTADKFEAMSKCVIELEPETKGQEQAYQELLGLIRQSQQNRTRITALIKQHLFFYEWLVLIALNTVVIFCIFYLNTHSIVSIVISTLLSTSTVILLFILRDLTRLVWKEQVWIWESLKQTFNEMGLAAYYPAAAIKEGRAKPTKGDKFRVANYTHPYPNFEDKRIEVV